MTSRNWIAVAGAAIALFGLAGGSDTFLCSHSFLCLFALGVETGVAFGRGAVFTNPQVTCKRAFDQVAGYHGQHDGLIHGSGK